MKKRRRVYGDLEGIYTRKGQRQVCGCQLTRTKNNRRQIRCPGVSPRFVSEKDALKFHLGSSHGHSCAFVKRIKRRRRK